MKTFVLFALSMPAALAAQTSSAEVPVRSEPSAEKSSRASGPFAPVPRARVATPPVDKQYHLHVAVPEPRYEFKLRMPRAEFRGEPTRPRRRAR